jgi:hypothetical protein
LLTYETSDFTTHLRAGSDPGNSGGYIRQRYPKSAGGDKGRTKGYSVSDAFKGGVGVNSGSLDVNLLPELSMDIEFDRYSGSPKAKKRRDYVKDLRKRDTPIDVTGHLLVYTGAISMLAGFKFNTADIKSNVGSAFTSLVEAGATTIRSWDSSDDDTHVVGPQPGEATIGTPQGSDGTPQESSKLNPFSIFGDYELLQCAAGLGGSNAPIKPPTCHIALSKSDSSLIADGEEPTGKRPPKRRSIPDVTSDLSERDVHGALVPRGNPRDFNVVDAAGLVLFVIRSLRYPSIGQLPSNPGDAYYAANNPDDCEDVTVTSDGANDVDYVTEHIVELQTLQGFLSFAATGLLPSGHRTTLPLIAVADLRRITENYNTWAQAAPNGNPVQRVFDQFGSTNNINVLVRAEAELNSVKARVSDKMP